MSWLRMIALICLTAACASDAPGDDATGSEEGVAGPPGPYFTHSMFWNRDVSMLPKAANSDALVDAIHRAGGWGNQDHMRIDFSFDVLRADASAPQTFVPDDSFEVPDCDQMAVPVPMTGNVEGNPTYKCSSGGDCHLIVLDEAAGTLYEMWKANISTTFSGGCLAV